MAKLDHAVMVPGLVVIVCIFWLWIPVWVIVWLARRARGKGGHDVELQSGHIPHKGFQPPKNSDYQPHRTHMSHFITAPLKTVKHHFHNAQQSRQYERKHGVKSSSERRQRNDGYAAERECRVQEVAREQRRQDKGKDRAVSISQVTLPESVVAQESQRRQRAEYSRR